MEKSPINIHKTLFKFFLRGYWRKTPSLVNIQLLSEKGASNVITGEISLGLCPLFPCPNKCCIQPIRVCSRIKPNSISKVQ